jgi:hypothetical protein
MRDGGMFFLVKEGTPAKTGYRIGHVDGHRRHELAISKSAYDELLKVAREFSRLAAQAERDRPERERATEEMLREYARSQGLEYPAPEVSGRQIRRRGERKAGVR